MASLGHVAIGLCAGRLHRPERPAAAMALFTALSLLPDADVVAFAFGIPYSHAFGHRGATHSLAFAVAAGALAATAWRLLHPAERWTRTFAFASAVVASHGLLDAMTNGGLGVAFFWPLSERRYFLPVKPLPVAPIGAGMLSPRGAFVLAVELVYFLPPLVYALLPRRAR